MNSMGMQPLFYECRVATCIVEDRQQVRAMVRLVLIRHRCHRACCIADPRKYGYLEGTDSFTHPGSRTMSKSSELRTFGTRDSMSCAFRKSYPNVMVV